MIDLTIVEFTDLSKYENYHLVRIPGKTIGIIKFEPATYLNPIEFIECITCNSGACIHAEVFEMKQRASE